MKENKSKRPAAGKKKAPKQGHGGSRPGAGKKKGQGVKEATIVRRYPLAIDDKVLALISDHKSSST